MIDLDKMAAEAMKRLRERINRSAAAHMRAMKQAWRARNDNNN